MHLTVGAVNVEPWLEARDKLLALADQLRNDSRIWVDHINLGGGFPLGMDSVACHDWTQPYSNI